MRRTPLVAIFLLLAALALGAVAVSAFEAHTVNVTAHVSSALSVSAPETALGTPGDPVSPLRWKNLAITVSLSNSFTGQDRVHTVDYRICAQPKPNTHPGNYPSDLAPYQYLWMGGASFVEFDELPGVFRWIGPYAGLDGITPPPPYPTGVVCPTGAADSLTNPVDPTDTVYLWLDVPVFQNIYNTADDIHDKPRNDLADCGGRLPGQPCVILPVGPADPDGTQLGLDLVIQVTGITSTGP